VIEMLVVVVEDVVLEVAVDELVVVVG